MSDWLDPRTLARFWAKVDRTSTPDGCWPWTGGFNTPAMRPWMGTRRPIFKLVQRGSRETGVQIVVYAHRLALAIHDGVPIWDRAGMQACHRDSCANPACVRPDHLYWGTEAENRADRTRVEGVTRLRARLGEL